MTGVIKLYFYHTYNYMHFYNFMHVEEGMKFEVAQFKFAFLAYPNLYESRNFYQKCPWHSLEILYDVFNILK